MSNHQFRRAMRIFLSVIGISWFALFASSVLAAPYYGGGSRHCPRGYDRVVERGYWHHGRWIAGRSYCKRAYYHHRRGNDYRRASDYRDRGHDQQGHFSTHETNRQQ